MLLKTYSNTTDIDNIIMVIDATKGPLRAKRAEKVGVRELARETIAGINLCAPLALNY